MDRTKALDDGEGGRTLPVLPFILVRWIDQLNDRVGRATSWITAVLVVVTTSDVLLRYVFNASFVFIHELEWHLFAVLFLMAAGYTHLKGKHVRVDILYTRLSPRRQALVDLAFGLLFLFPTCFLLIKSSLPFVAHSWAVLEGSPDPGGLPARYLLKAVIPVGFILIGLQGISETIKNTYIVLQGKLPSGLG
ncbi:MAG: TRAP transporter small permease subunit [candidate division NC10 bacterium]